VPFIAIPPTLRDTNIAIWLIIFQSFLWLKAAHDRKQADQRVAPHAPNFVIFLRKSRLTLSLIGADGGAIEIKSVEITVRR
jgi:hypothetical protein